VHQVGDQTKEIVGYIICIQDIMYCSKCVEKWTCTAD